jgi:hypothetical protein
MRRSRLQMGLFVLLTGTCLSSATLAQVDAPQQNVGVMDIPRPYYDPKGIPLGGFRLFPSMGVSDSYDDNIFRIPGSTTGDHFVTLTPVMRLQSQWGLHFLELYTGAASYNYIDNDNQSLTDWNVGTQGRLDIVRGAYVRANVQYAQMHEFWSSPNTQPGFQLSPNRYFNTHAEVTGAYQPSSFGVGAGFSYDRFNWTNTPAIGGGFISNDDRDNDETQFYVKTFYDFSPGYAGFLKYAYDKRAFDLSFDRTGVSRTAEGYHIGGGVDLQISELLAGSVLVGYLTRDFSNFARAGVTPLKDFSGIDYDIQLDWFVRPDLTLHLSGKRTLNNVVLTGVSLADDKPISIGADYEFRQNVIVQGKFAYTYSNYVGTSRTDEYPSIMLGVRYLVNAYGSLNLSYTYSDRSSNISFFNFSDNTVSLGFKLQI